MRLIVDNNQLSDIRKTTGLSRAMKRQITLILPPLIWAEATKCPDSLRCLLEYTIRFGKDIAEALADAASATDAQLMNLETLIPRRSAAHRRCLVDFRECPPERVRRALEIKQGSRADNARAGAAFQEALRKDRDACSRGGDACLMKDIAILDDFIAPLHPAFEHVLFHNPDDDPGPAPSFGRLLACGNVRLANFARFELSYHLARTGSWKDRQLNLVGPSGKRDDVPDRSPPLYADKGDVIVSNDATFTRLFKSADVTGSIPVLTWKQCLRTVL